MQKMNQKQFAESQGWARSYVTELKKANRLVLDDSGLVDVEASLALIKQTEDPNRDDVRSRHASKRGQGEAAAPAESKPAKPSAETSSYQSARASKEHFLAKQAELDYLKAAGKLVEMDSVRSAGAEIGAQIRATLENLPDQLAPELAPIIDAEQLHAILVEKVQEILNGLSQRLTQAVEKLAEVA